MGNSILTGLDLLRAREQQKLKNRRAEEQQEIENVQAQKEQSLAEKEQKRRQKVTDLNTQVLERQFALDTAVERLQFEEGQAIGRTPSETAFQLPEVAEGFTGPREGGISGQLDTSGLAGPFGAPSFQSEDRQNELIQAFGVNQQLQNLQQQQKTLSSPSIVVAEIKAAQDELERLTKLDIADTKEAADERRFMATLASNRLVRLATLSSRNEVRALVEQNRNSEASALIPGFSDGTLKFSSTNKAHQKALSMMSTQGKVIFNFDTRATMERIVRTTSLLDRLETFVRNAPELFPVGDSISEPLRKSFIENISSKFGEAAVKIAEFEAFNRQLSSDAQDLTGEPASRISDKDIKILREGMGQPGDGLRVILTKINSARIDLANNLLGQTVNVRNKDFNTYASVVGQVYANSPSMLPFLLKRGGKTTDRTLETNPSVGGPDEEARIMPDGELFWWNPKTGDKRERVK